MADLRAANDDPVRVKIDLRFEVCADGHVTWLESRIIYPQHLRRMDDEFFELLVGLRQFGAWKFDSLDGPDKVGSCSNSRMSGTTAMIWFDTFSRI